jgi:C-terminal processing protease CtpA/Prc
MLVLLALLLAAPVGAQTDTVRFRVVSTWQKDVDQLRQELMDQRKLELELYKRLALIEMRRMEAAVDSQRTELIAQSRLVSTMLQQAGIEQFRLRRQLESKCAEVRKPTGWLGVATTGVKMIARQGDGTQVDRFLEPPVVESVDPGSPADRVGLRAGDVLIEIGGKQLLQTNVVFAELLRPGEKVLVKFRRGGEVMSLSPVVEPAPVVTTTPCTWVDAGTAYVMSPTPAQARIVEARPSTGGGRFGYMYTRGSRDSAGVVARATATSGTVVEAGPMAVLYGPGSRSVAGLELFALNLESGRAFGVTHGLFVNQVLPGTIGREAGLQGGDVLVSADSVDLRSVIALQRVLSRSNDRSVTLVFVRGKKTETVQLRW